MFRRWRIDQDYRELCAAQHADDRRISEAASMLMLAQSGVVLNDETIARMAENLGSMADEYGLAPEEVQVALRHNEPSLEP